MATLIDTVFEKGVFRPIKPVSIPENRRVRISLEDSELTADHHASFSPLPVGLYPFEDLGEDFDFPSIPLEEVGKMHVKLVFAGDIPPLPYPED